MPKVVIKQKSSNENKTETNTNIESLLDIVSDMLPDAPEDTQSTEIKYKSLEDIQETIYDKGGKKEPIAVSTSTISESTKKNVESEVKNSETKEVLKKTIPEPVIETSKPNNRASRVPLFLSGMAFIMSLAVGSFVVYSEINKESQEDLYIQIHNLQADIKNLNARNVVSDESLISLEKSLTETSQAIDKKDEVLSSNVFINSKKLESLMSDYQALQSSVNEINNTNEKSIENIISATKVLRDSYDDSANKHKQWVTDQLKLQEEIVVKHMGVVVAEIKLDNEYINKELSLINKRLSSIEH